MTPAASPRLLELLTVDPAQDRVAQPVRPSIVRATISTRDGRTITGGTLEFTESGACWHARMRDLDRGGLVATMYFSGGVREVLVRLEDGRRGVARITATSFIAASQRVCDLAGTSPLN